MAVNHFHAVIFDAGSSGTRPFIYRISQEIVDDDGFIHQHAQVVEVVNHDGRSLNISEPMGTGIHEVDDIAAHLSPLFDDVEGVLMRSGVNLPVKYYLYATGGVRDNLNEIQQNNLRANVEAYMEAQEIAQADYEYEPISGADEAKYGWVAAHRSLGRPYNAGYVEMGGATAQIAFPLPDDANVLTVAEGIATDLDLVNVVDVGHQNLFLASYPLGSKAGFDKYEEALFTQGGNLGLTGEAEGNQQIFFDPSRRQGSPDKVAGDNTIRFRPAGDFVGAQSNPAKTLTLTGIAVDALFPGAAITQPLDEVLGQLDFIGASNFWHTMRVALNDAGAVTPALLHQAMRNNREMTHAAMNAILVEMPAGDQVFMRPILEKSIFTTQWTLRVLRQAFGIPLTQIPGDDGVGVTFTPYGDDHNRFSWTLGTAVLLASPAPTNLVAAVPAIRVPAPP